MRFNVRVFAIESALAGMLLLLTVFNSLFKAVLEPLARELPAIVAQRPKQGLRVPWRIYRTKTLRDYFAETILQTSRKSGLFDHLRLESWVRRLAASPKQRAAQPWPICHFCLWWNRFIDGDAGASAWTGDDRQ